MKNIGRPEQRYRYLWTLLILADAWFAPGGWRMAFAVAGVYLALTAWARFCPLWWFVGADTREIGSIDVYPVHFAPRNPPKPRHSAHSQDHDVRRSA